MRPRSVLAFPLLLALSAPPACWTGPTEPYDVLIAGTWTGSARVNAHLDPNETVNLTLTFVLVDGPTRSSTGTYAVSSEHHSASGELELSSVGRQRPRGKVYVSFQYPGEVPAPEYSYLPEIRSVQFEGDILDERTISGVLSGVFTGMITLHR